MRYIALPLAICLTFPVAAQDAQEDRDRGFLTALIEDNLSAPGLSVRIDGFQGALSSEATLDALTISDDEGPWLRLEDVVLDWNRSALLRGRLEVGELSAALISVERAPLPAEGVEALPDAGASGFSIPDLPVSVEIGSLRADRIDLGAALLGQELALTLEAQASLSGGSADIAIQAQRLDGVTGTFDITAAFDAETTAMTIDLDITEAQGGIATTLLQLPGAPAINLTVQGSGPLDEFTADVAIASDGLERLGGQVALAGVDDGRRFTADLGGDMTSLFAPRYRPFFGDDVGLTVAGLMRVAGGVDLETLDVTTEALTLQGAAVIGADGWPEMVDVTGRISSADGTPVILPTADATSVRDARFVLRFDEATSEDWQLDLSVDDVDHPTLVSLDTAELIATGQLTRTDGIVSAADADVNVSATGLAFADPSLDQAIGPQASFGAQIGWATGEAVQISDLELRGPALTADGSIFIAVDDSALPISLDLTASISDLARLSGLAGRDLGGAAELTVSGALSPLGGAFDVALSGTAADLATGIAQADAVLTGQTVLSAQARRDATGTYLDTFSLANPQAIIDGNATLLAEDAPARAEGRASQASLSVVLADGAVLDPRLAGQITANAQLGEDSTGSWTGNASLSAPQGVTAEVAGTLTGPTPDVTFDLSVLDIAAFAEGVPGALTASGRAFATDGIWSVDADATGPWELTASVDGVVTGDAPAITYSARLPDLTAPVPTLDAVPALAGPIALQGTLTQQDGIWITDTRADAPQGVILRLRGPVTGDAPRLDVAATVPQVQTFVSGVEGTLSLDAVLAKSGDDWTVNARATGPYDARATVATVLTDTPLAVDFTLAVPRLAAIAPGIPGRLDVAGLAIQETTGWRVDLSGTGPYDADLTVNARLPEAGPEVTINARIPDASDIAPQLSGPLTVAARAEQRDGIWSVDGDASGPFGATATVQASLPEAGAEVSAQVSLPNAAALSPQLSGPLNVDAAVQQRDGVWRADVDASGPFGGQLDASGVVFGAPADVQIDLSIPDIAPIVGDISGPLRVTGQVSQPGTNYRLNLDLVGPSGTRADVSGTVATDGTLDLAVNGTAPLGLANPFIEPQRLSGTAQFDLAIAGPPAVGSITGTLRTSGSTLSLPTLRNGLTPIDATIALSGGRAQLDLTAGLDTGGRIEVTGPVTLSAPFDANLNILFGVTLADPSLYTADLEGNVSLSGPLTGGALISGNISVQKAEIAVPSSGLTAIGDLPPIDHLSTPRPVQRTLERAGQGVTAVVDSGPSGPGFGLDLTVKADGRIFVRGRGLDAELGGNLRLTGTTNSPVTAGGFELIRGRLDVLQQRFDLDEGEISFQGDLTPYIRLVAITETDTITASINVEGAADDIGVTFSSTPDVPQEEILAQIFFGRDLSQLSALQALQLANSIAVLAGRGSGGLLEKLRGTAGLDDLDLTTDSEGNTAIRAGKYISDNVYTDVEIDQDGDATISLNLDLTPSLTVRGSTGVSGESSLGIFFQKDY